MSQDRAHPPATAWKIPSLRFGGTETPMAVLFALAYVLMLSEPLSGLETRALLAGLGALYVLVATAGFAAVRRRPRVAWGLTYLGAQHLLGMALVVLGGLGIGNVLLLLLVLSQATRVLPLGWVLATCTMLPFLHAGMRWDAALREGLGLLVAGVFVVLITHVAVNEGRLRAEKEALAEELAHANARLRVAAAQAEELTTARERNRLAREIHDGLGHHLTAVHVQLQAAQAVLRPDPERAGQALERARALTGEALADVRRSVAALRTLPGPLPEALGVLAQETTASGVPTTVQVLGAAGRLDPAVEQSLYRVAQEALTNVRKHAGATRASVTLDHRPEAVALTVRDDGVGLSAPGDGFGLLGVRERVAALGGEVQLDTSPGRGLTLRVTVPT